MTENREMLSSLIYRTNKMLKRDLQDHLKPYGITTDQWMVLPLRTIEENIFCILQMKGRRLMKKR